MKVVKMSVSFDPELGEAIRVAAAKVGQPVSTWVADAAAHKLRNEALGEFLDAYEAEYGAFTPEEIAQAEAELRAARVEAGLPPGGL